MKCKYLIVIIFIGLICLSGQVFAKYILTRTFDVNVTTAPFYFDVEMETTNLEVINNEASLGITLKNYTSEENYNEYDTKYEIKLEDESKYSILIEDTNNSLIFGENANSNQITINFIPVSNTSLKINEEVTLLINSLSPYKKQISKTINLNKPDAEIAFGSLDDFRKISEEDCLDYSESYGNYETLYGGNDGQLEYDSDGALILDEDNPILFLEIEDSELFQNEYSIYFTIKADVMQGEEYGNTIASIGEGNGMYLSWISIYQGYLQIYSYTSGNLGKDFAEEAIGKGYASYDISKYSNTIFNVQVVSSKTGNTKVYINGEELTSFESGGEDIATTYATIGELRPMRNLKLNGTLYDFAMYNKLLTEDEVETNWQHAKNKWINN